MTNSNPNDKARSNDTIQKVAPPPVPKSTKQRNDKDSDTSPKNGNEHGAKFVEKFGKKFETPAKKSKNLKDSCDPKEDKTESKRTESKRDKSAQSPEETTKTDANALAKDDDGAATCGEEKSKSDDEKAKGDEKSKANEKSKGDEKSSAQEKSANARRSHFEGTNEVFIQSRAFDDFRNAIDPPVVHAFEGTNEVYVRSSAFDALRDDAAALNASGSSDSNEIRAILGNSQESSSKIRFQSVKVKPPVLQHKPQTSDANIIGIMGSGVLPSVDIDKSFEVPVLDDGMLDQTHEIETDPDTDAVRVPKKGDSLAVYASRMNSELNALQVELHTVSGVPGLPPRSEVEENACVHPENVVDAATIRASNARYAIDHVIDARLIDIFGSELDQKDTSHATTIDALMTHLIDTQDALFPKAVVLSNDCSMTQWRVMRQFLNRCVESVPNFSCYAPAWSVSDAQIDLVTSLVGSRLGCLPDDPDELKSETLIHHANTVFAQSDFQWGIDILFVRYGLGNLVSKNRSNEIDQLVARSACDMRELFLNIVARDAEQGPVVVVLTPQARGCENAWRDVFSWLRKLATSNVLVVFVGANVDWANESFEAVGMASPDAAPSNALDSSDNSAVHAAINSPECREKNEEKSLSIETVDIAPLSPSDVRNLIEHVVGQRYLTPACIQKIAEKSRGRFDILRMLLIMFKNLGFLSKKDAGDSSSIVAYLDQIEANHGSIEQAYVASFDEETYNFLAWASMLGNVFYIQDLIQIMDLEPLPDEPIWSHPLRTTWCEEIAKKCCRDGILVEVSVDEQRGTRYCIVGSSSFRRQVSKQQPEFARQIHGCYAQVLVNTASGISCAPACAAIHFEEANMLLQAVQIRLACAQRFCNRFENLTALEEIGFCLAHVGPENGSIYADVLALYAELSCRIGEFSVAREACMQRLAYEKFIHNCTGAVGAMIAFGDILRTLGEYADAQRYLLKAVELSEEIEDKALISDAYYALGALAFEMGAKGALVNGLRYAEKALEIQRTIGNLVKIAEIQTLCARIFMMRGEPERARTAASEAYYGLVVSHCWYKTPPVLIVMAESAAALSEGLPLDFVERGLEIAAKTGQITDLFYLLSMRIRLLMTTLERSQVRADMDRIASIVADHPSERWRTEYFYLLSKFDFARKNYKKTTRSLRLFFDSAQRLGNAFMLSCGYDLSAMLNLDVLRRELGIVSKEKTEKLHNSATALFESVGAWHYAAESLRHYANYLDYFKRPADAKSARIRADKVDPYCQ